MFHNNETKVTDVSIIIILWKNNSLSKLSPGSWREMTEFGLFYQ